MTSIAAVAPTAPRPVGAEVPAWATQADEWEWVPVDDVWQRTVSRPFRWAEGGGFDVTATQAASADETATTPPPDIMVDLADGTINNAADARQLGQWLIEAADVLEQIEAAR